MYMTGENKVMSVNSSHSSLFNATIGHLTLFASVSSPIPPLPPNVTFARSPMESSTAVAHPNDSFFSDYLNTDMKMVGT